MNGAVLHSTHRGMLYLQVLYIQELVGSFLSLQTSDTDSCFLSFSSAIPGK